MACAAVENARCVATALPRCLPIHLALPLPLCLRCRRALDGELYFYGRALGFAPPMPADFEPIEIENLA